MKAVFAVPAVALVALLAVSGCPDPEGSFDDFVRRVDELDLSAAVPDSGPSQIHDITGTFFVTFAAAISPGTPFQLIATTKLTPQADGTAIVDISVQPLDAMTREPVGQPLASNGNPVSADGKFMATLAGMLPGPANPISFSDVTVELTLDAVIRSANRFCGPVTGMVSKPVAIDLTGSEFAAVRIEPGTKGSALPAPDVSCAVEMPGADAGVMDMGPVDLADPGDAGQMTPVDAM